MGKVVALMNGWLHTDECALHGYYIEGSISHSIASHFWSFFFPALF